MIYILTIIIAGFIVWNIISAGLCLDEYDMSIDILNDGVLLTLSKLYWWAIIISIIGCIVSSISYHISKAIICNGNKGDNKICIKEKK